MIMSRVRAFAAQLALLAALAALATFLSAGPGRIANGITDDGLRSDLATLAYTNRDLTFTLARDFDPAAAGGPDRAGRLDEIRAGLPAPIPGLISDGWFVDQVGPVNAAIGDLYFKACPTLVGVRRQTGSDEATTMVEGRRPKSTPRQAEAIVGTDEAKALGVEVGELITLNARSGTATVRVVGRYDPVDPDAPIWADMKLARVACPTPDEDTRYRATLLTDAAGAELAGSQAAELKRSWRYRLDEQRITADRIPELTGAVAQIRRNPPKDTALQSGVDATLADFDQRLRAVQAVLAVVRAGILATMAGLILLAARLSADRRRNEYALIRARGGSVLAIAGRSVAETLLVVLPAAALGWLAGTLSPGRPEPWEPAIAAAFALLAVVAPAVLAATGARRPDFTGHRQDLTAGRPTPRRITFEVSLIGLAAGGAYLLRSRGIGAGAGGGTAGVDPFLVAVPVLLAVAASVIALRLAPYPLRAAGRLAARARGAVAFLGLAGAGRGAPMRSWPLSVLVVAIATGIFAGTVATTVGHGRDRAADVAVPADALVTGFSFAVDTPAAIAALPGVDRATPMLVVSAAEVRSDSSSLISQVQGLVLDTAGSGLDLPAALRDAPPAASPDAVVPVVVSPRLAQRVGASGKVDIQGRRYAFRVAAVQERVPGLNTSVREFILVPGQALPVPDFQPIVPNRILLDGSGWDTGAVLAAADEGQRAQTKKATGQEITDRFELNMPAYVTTRAQYRASLDERGVDGVLSFTFVAGLAASAALALLAVALTVLAGAPARGRNLSRLRTLGLSTRQGRRLLVFELVPLLGAAVLAGALAGAGLPALIAPALGLDDFTAGVPAELSADPLLAAGVLAVTVLAVIAALVVEDVANRRLRLGTVLRLGGEES
jgi:putative ABC transport system permease protein